MSATQPLTVAPIATGRRSEASFPELAFHALLLVCLMIGLLTLVALLVDVARDGLGRLNAEFVSSLDSRFPERAGIKPALAGSAWL
ncbi:MAG: hypothetical protein ACRDJF_12545, partial [Actinomycetota bacterium]